MNKIFSEIAFENHWQQLTYERIIEFIGCFPGDKEFIDFYLAKNGGAFTEGATFYANDFYKVPDDYQDIPVDSFLHIPLSENEDDKTYTYSIEKEKNRRSGVSEEFDKFILFHIPFADNEGDNTFWIDIQTGEIKYTDFEDMGYDPKKTIVVASSFSDFCKRIKNI